MDRKSLAVKSSIISITTRLISIGFAFLSRKFFLMYLGTDLLGVNSTLVQVLDTLALSELGFQTAIIYQLYRPIVEKDYEKISQIMSLLKKAYNIIGIVILIAGFILLPFLEKIITNVDVDFGLIYTVYIIMLLGTVLSYFSSYTRALISADQRIYISNIIDSGFLIITNLIKIYVLVQYRSFIVFVCVGVFNTVFSNLFNYTYYKKHYFWIDRKARAEESLKKELFHNIKDVFVLRLAGYVYSSTDNLVISIFIGTAWVGLVGNYSTITNSIKSLILGLTAPIQPMLGNYLVINDKDAAEKTMMNYGFVRFAIALVLLVPTMCFSDMFVFLFYGEEFVLKPIISWLLSIELLIVCLQGAVGEMIDALGYFNDEKKMCVVYAIFNILFSCIGASLVGITMVFLATVLTQILGWIWRSIIAYKKYFQDKTKLYIYWKEQIKYVLFFMLIVSIIKIFMSCVNISYSYVLFFVGCIASEIFSLIIFVLFFRRKEEFKYLLLLINKIIIQKKFQNNKD